MASDDHELSFARLSALAMSDVLQAVAPYGVEKVQEWFSMCDLSIDDHFEVSGPRVARAVACAGAAQVEMRDARRCACLVCAWLWASLSAEWGHGAHGCHAQER